MKIINSSIFETNCKYIVHQCNAVSTKAIGLAKTLFISYPYADFYSKRIKPDTPGTIIINNNIIALIAQYYPGKPKYFNDSEQQREKWFYQCLLKLAKISNLESLAFPYGIGCGLAGGNWEHYYKTIENFANFMKTKDVDVIIYKQ